MMFGDVCIAPCHDAGALRTYIDQHWQEGHILARSEEMFRFQYQTPWVDRTLFPSGVSALCAYEGEPGGPMVGFLGAIMAPYPSETSLWLALWHVLPERKGTGLGGELMEEMRRLVDGAGAWMGGFGAGPQALPVYLKRSFCVRASRRWVFDSRAVENKPRILTPGLMSGLPGPPGPPAPPPNSCECDPDEAWLRYRFDEHPVLSYERVGGHIVRSDRNAYGQVVHVCRHGAPDGTLEQLHREAADEAARDGVPLLMDAWSARCPGLGWQLASPDLPSVFHPPAARGNIIHAIAHPYMPVDVQKGDGDQDRPN